MQVAPLLRASEVRALRELIRAAPAVWPYPGHGSLGAPTAKAPTFKPFIELPAAGTPAGDRAGACAIERAPEGSSGAAVGGSDDPANACSPAQPNNAERTILRQAQDERVLGHDVDEESTQEFVDRVLAGRDRVARILAKPAPIDWNRVADAHQRKAREARGETPGEARRLPVALSPEECRRCGIPGRKGCAHQAAYEPLPCVKVRDVEAPGLPEDKRRVKKTGSWF